MPDYQNTANFSKKNFAIDNFVFLVACRPQILSSIVGKLRIAVQFYNWIKICIQFFEIFFRNTVWAMISDKWEIICTQTFVSNCTVIFRIWIWIVLRYDDSLGFHKEKRPFKNVQPEVTYHKWSLRHEKPQRSLEGILFYNLMQFFVGWHVLSADTNIISNLICLLHSRVLRFYSVSNDTNILIFLWCITKFLRCFLFILYHILILGPRSVGYCQMGSEIFFQKCYSSVKWTKVIRWRGANLFKEWMTRNSFRVLRSDLFNFNDWLFPSFLFPPFWFKVTSHTDPT